MVFGGTSVSEVTLLLMTGIRSTGEVEQMMGGARQAITQDIIERAQRVSRISQVVLSTNALPLAEWAQSRGVTVELDPPADRETEDRWYGDPGICCCSEHDGVFQYPEPQQKR